MAAHRLSCFTKPKFSIPTLALLIVLSLSNYLHAQSVAQSENGISAFHAGRDHERRSESTESSAGTNSDHPDSVLRIENPRPQHRPDFNQSVYYANKLELTVEGGWFAKNVPFPFDFLQGGDYTKDPLPYTLAPVNVYLRWHLGDLRGRRVLRGNWDATFGVTGTAVPRGPEARYFGYTMGIRRNFVPRHWRAAPYLDGHVGIGHIDARAPYGVGFAQGQDLVFTLNLGSGLRYNISPRYALSLGVGYMHISNMYLSEPKYFNYGINVIGPQLGVSVRLGHARNNVSR